MDAIRVSDSPRSGSEFVAGICIQSPGSRCIGTGVPSAFPVAMLVTSLMACTYETPLRKMSFCFSSPRFGTLPREGENERVSVVRLSSRTFSLGGLGGAGETGLGNVVVVGGPLLGRKIRLNPVPAKFPLKFAKTPREAGAGEGLLGVGPGPNLSSTGCIWKPAGIVIPAPGLTEPDIAPGVRLSNRKIRSEGWKRDIIQEVVFAQ